MILIPEIQKVVLLTPRTGSTSLKLSVREHYPKSMLLHRHIEADGVPFGYDRWEKVGVVRHPLDRLWSLFKLLKTIDGGYDPEWIKEQRQSVQGVSFSDWICGNRVVFTSSRGREEYTPSYAVRHALPETKKSQWESLRPDLGTTIYKFEDVNTLADALQIRLGRYNGTASSPPPDISKHAEAHINKYFAWDLEQYKEEEANGS